MKITVEVKDEAEAQALEYVLSNALARQFVAVIGSVMQLPLSISRQVYGDALAVLIYGGTKP